MAAVILPRAVAACVLALSAVAWYSAVLDANGDADDDLGSRFQASYLVWVLLATAAYVVLGLWCAFVDVSMRASLDLNDLDRMVSKLVPWNGKTLVVAFFVGYTAFALACRVASMTATRGSALLPPRRRGMFPVFSTADAASMNYVKGYCMTVAWMTVVLILSSIGARSSGR